MYTPKSTHMPIKDEREKNFTKNPPHFQCDFWFVCDETKKGD